jgi:hypothetical protein
MCAVSSRIVSSGRAGESLNGREGQERREGRPEGQVGRERLEEQEGPAKQENRQKLEEP